MRSSAEPRISHDGAAHLTTPNGQWNGAVLNLSVGGAFVTGVPVLPNGTEIALDLDLRDGEPPVAADARVVWSRMSQQTEGPAGVALRFARVAHDGVRRIARLVAARMEITPGLLRRKVRVRLPGLETPLRAVASDVTPETVMVESELGWLQLGAAVSTELAPGDVRNGRLQWVGVDVAPSGAARLRLAIDVSGKGLVSETPEEAAFFAGERIRPPALPSPSGAYDSMEIEMPRRRPRRGVAVFCGVLLGCAVGGGLSWAQPRLGLRTPSFVSNLLHGHRAMIEDEVADSPPIYRSAWRTFPRAQ
jgi:PilZ domain-containing protein